MARLLQDGMEVDDEVIVAEIPSAMGSSASARSSPSAKSMPVHILSPYDCFIVKRRVQDLERCIEVLDIQEDCWSPQEGTQDSVSPFWANGLVSFISFVYSSCSCLYLETEQLIALQWEFILLEGSSLSCSRHEAELHAHLIVAQSILQLDIMAVMEWH